MTKTNYNKLHHIHIHETTRQLERPLVRTKKKRALVGLFHVQKYVIF